MEKKQSTFMRLAAYMKPYIKSLILAFVFMLIVTVVELYKPILIGNAIDLYIEDYDTPYSIVESGEIEFRGEHLSEELYDCEYVSQLVLVEGDYYYFDHLTINESNELSSITDGSFDYTIDGDVVSIDGFTGDKLTSSDLKILRQGDISGIQKIAVLYVVLLVFGFIASFGQTWILQLTGQNIIYTIRNQLFHHIHSLPLKYFDTHPVGSIVTRVTNDVESLHEMYANILARLIKNLVKIIGLAGVMLYLNTELALCSFIMIPVIAILTYISRDISRKLHREIRNKVSDLNTFLSENISGMKLIQIFANEDLKFKEFKGKSKNLYKANFRQITVFAIFRPLIYFLSELALAIVIYVGSKNVIETTITLGTLYVFINYIGNLFDPIQELAEQLSTLQNAMASSEKIFTVLDEKNTILEKDEVTKPETIKGKIEFKHVWFAYEGDNYVLKDVSFVIEPGQRVAFVGATGAGKSSILNLVGRYYDIQKGQILIDDIDIRDMSIRQIREAIGQVQQDVFIFTGDVNSNIRLLDESISDETIKESAKFVNADHFIDTLPHTYEEPLSERGANLSAGQRQLLSFARTLAYDPKILVMDEATANIDTETEALIQDALEHLMHNRTTIMVAHRLSTIQHADNIIVLHKGEIKESGTHQELLKNDGIYKKLYELQLYSVD